MDNRTIVLVEEKQAKQQKISHDLFNRAWDIRVVSLPDLEFMMMVFLGGCTDELEDLAWDVASYYPVTYPYQTIWYDGKFKWERSYVITEDTFYIPLDTFAEHPYLYEQEWLEEPILKHPFEFFHPVRFEMKGYLK